jgi:phosphatidylserine/phosphatidylglycerophosphate/cardiolipin synthase-like enzyme
MATALLLATGVHLLTPPPVCAEIRIPAEVVVAFREDCEKLLLRRIRRARKSILVAAYSFTSADFAAALREARQNGVEVSIKIDRSRAQEEYTGQLVERLRRARVSVKTIGMPERCSMHNKFVIIDEKTVLTGSFNFTVAAATKNWENLVCIESQRAAKAFAQEWKLIRSRRWAR